MANFLKAFGKHIEHTVISQPKHILTDVAHGRFDKAFNDYKSTFGQNERDLQQVFQGAGIRGWVGKHPQESIGALVATVFGGWAAWGAYGAGAAGGAAGTAGGAAGGATGAGSALAYTPTASTALGGAGSFSGASTGAFSAAGSGAGAGAGAGAGSGFSFASASTPSLSYMPTQSTVLGGSGSGISGSTATSGSTTFGQIKKYADLYQKVNALTGGAGQGGQQGQGMDLSNHNYALEQLRKMQSQDKFDDNPVSSLPQTTTQLLNGVDLSMNNNNVQFFNNSAFGG
ncbi:hypothetical protein G6S93_004415 [Salmonella enterica]|nr:hypothetical protein [Salmonella enterica]